MKTPFRPSRLTSRYDRADLEPVEAERPAGWVDRADGVARARWSTARRKKLQATWAKMKAAKAKGA